LALAMTVAAGVLTGCNHHAERDTNMEAAEPAVVSRIEEPSRTESNRYTQYQTQRSDFSNEQAIQFEFDSADLTDDAKTYLDRLANAYKERGDSLEEISVHGYTDATGPEEYNNDLSKRRAESVRNYLQQKGINANSWDVEGFGEENPIASNDDQQGRSENRRVVVEFSGGNEGLSSSFSPD